MTNNSYKQVRNNVDGIKVRVVPWISNRNSASCSDNFDSTANYLIQNHSNFDQSAPPERFMCFEDGSWVDLEEDALALVRSSFLERKPVVEVVAGGSRWLIHFYLMLMVNFESEESKSVAWIDVHGKCFFPMRFVSGGGMANRGGGFRNLAEKSYWNDVSKIEIEIKIPTVADGENSHDQQSELKRKVCESPELKKRKLFLSDCESPRWPNAKLLNEEEKPYQTVKNLFLSRSGLAGAMITGIHRFPRTDRFEVFQKQIEKTKTARGGEANATFAWHGTSAQAVESIFANGFGMPSKVPHSEVHGVGVYLSPVHSPHIGTMLSEEVDAYGERHAILCRIILGKCEKVEARSQQSCPSSVNFDTGVDDLAHPKWYIVWCANMKTHLLPECVVSYRLSNEVPGRLNVSQVPRLMQNGSTPPISMLMQNGSTKWTMLLPKLESSLPAPKVREIHTLYGAYKNGKLPKDIFVKQLRSIVGDKILLSALHEIHG